MIKKFTIIGLLLAIFFSTNTANASTRQEIPNNYYFIRPILNQKLYVRTDTFTLADGFDDLEKFEFFYLPDKEAFVINDQLMTGSVKWTGESGVGNLVLSRQNVNDPYMLWTVEDIGKGQYIIRNKKDPSMVWDVNNANATVGEHIKVEKIHSSDSPNRSAQVFLLDAGR